MVDAHLEPSPPSRWRKERFVDFLRVAVQDKRNNGSWLLPATQAMVHHRSGEWLLDPSRSRAVRFAGMLLYRVAYVYLRNIAGIEIPPTTQIGRDVTIAHQHGIVVHPFARIGDRTKIHHGVTIGLRDDRESGAGRMPNRPPVLGCDVLIGVGAVILGGVAIGDRATIGPLAVVTRDVPAGASVVAMPSRILALR